MARLGYPISRRTRWDGFTVQVTQRGVLQWRPESRRVEIVNVYDRLHDLGKDAWLQTAHNLPAMADWSSDTGKGWEQVQANHLDVLRLSAPLREAYLRTADPVQTLGLPMAPPTTLGPFTLLRCQRAALQLWLVDSPESGARTGQVVQTLAGEQAKQAGLVDGQAFAPEPAPPRPVTQPASGGAAGDAEQYVLAFVNRQRAAVGVAPLAVDPRLVRLAREHSQLMADRGGVSHAGADGSSPQARIKAAGLAWGTENIGYSAYPDRQAAVDWIDSWLVNDALHRRQLLDPQWKVIGIGLASTRGATYLTEDFGR